MSEIWADLPGDYEYPPNPNETEIVIPPIEPGIDKRRPPDPRYGAIPPEGRFIEPPEREPKHQCPLPQQWTSGALWQCPLGHLWVVENACECRGNIERHHNRGIHAVGYAWWPATWRQRRKYGPGMKRADLSMAPAGLREENPPKPQPPKGPSGMSPGRGGYGAGNKTASELRPPPPSACKGAPEDFDG